MRPGRPKYRYGGRTRARLPRDPDIGCIGRSTNGAIPCMHRGTAHKMCEVWKPLAPLPSRAVVEQRVYGVVGARRDGGPDLRPAIVEYIIATGDCVWHACAVVGGNAARCSCAACAPTDPRRPWRELDLRFAAEAAP